MNDRCPPCLLADRSLRWTQVEAARVAGHPTLDQQAAPARDLVLTGAPFRAACAWANLGMRKGDHATRAAGTQHPMALRPPAVEVERDVAAVEPLVEWRQRSSVDDLVDRAGQHGDSRECHGRGQHPSMLGEVLGDGPQGRNRGQQVAEPQGPEHDRARRL
jgi:hypothetical protein